MLDALDNADFAFSPPPGAKIVRFNRRPDGRPIVNMPLSVRVEVSAKVLRAAVRLWRRPTN